MSDPAPSADQPRDNKGGARFRWQALLQSATEALFILDRRRRILFVNRAWEALTGIKADEARGLLCRRPEVEESQEDVLARLLAPPREAREGRFVRVRRLYSSRLSGDEARQLRWWDIEFFPLRQGDSTLSIGRILPLPLLPDPLHHQSLLPERLMSLRMNCAARFDLSLLESELPAMHRLREQARLAAGVRVPVLIVGEPGAGKATVARIIHQMSDGKEQSFASLDCARLSVTDLERVLFGDRDALLRTAVGTIYLRHLAALPREVQLKLISWLDQKTPRLIACSALPLANHVASGKLLEDLAWRLQTLVLEIPPLRQRSADLPRLIDRILSRLNERGKTITGLSPEAMHILRGYSWAGNLTELFDVLRTAHDHASDRIEPADLPSLLRLGYRLGQESGSASPRPLPLLEILEKVERRLIELALRKTKDNRTKAAELLSIWRPRLLRRMEALGLIQREDSEPEGS